MWGGGVRGYLLDALEIWSMGKCDNDAAEVSVVKMGCTACGGRGRGEEISTLLRVLKMEKGFKRRRCIRGSGWALQRRGGGGGWYLQD
jgi:hypothetical protein